MEEDLFEHIDTAALESRQRSDDTSYVIEGADKVLSIKSKSKDEETTNDVQLTQSFSAAERVERVFIKAKEEGLVVELLDSEEKGGDEKEPASYVAPVVIHQTPGTVKVKTESACWTGK
jgi:hypothetical protein